MTADSRPTERAMKAAVEMEMHATVGTTTVAKGETLDKCFPAYDEFLSASKKLVSAFDEIRSATTAERIITGRSDSDIRRESNEALGELRNAIAKAEGIS